MYVCLDKGNKLITGISHWSVKTVIYSRESRHQRCESEIYFLSLNVDVYTA